MSQQVDAPRQTGPWGLDAASTSPESLTKVISNATRAAIKRLWGRGPTFVRVLLPNDDTVVVLLTGILTDAERSLLAVERRSAVMSQRAALHDALEPHVRAILETNLGRDTDAFMSGIDLDRDMASLIVTLCRSESSAPTVLITPDRSTNQSRCDGDVAAMPRLAHTPPRAGGYSLDADASPSPDTVTR